jgi:hypothetical protein
MPISLLAFYIGITEVPLANNLAIIISMLVSESVLLMLFGAGEIFKILLILLAAWAIGFSIRTLRESFSEDSIGQHEFLRELGLEDKEDVLSQWEVRRLLFMLASGVGILILVFGLYMLVKLTVAALAVAVLWHYFNKFRDDGLNILAQDLDNALMDQNATSEDRSDYHAPDLEGFQQFESRRH